jgi:hypothetical protein
MTESGRSAIQWRAVGDVALAALGGALLTVLALLLFYQTVGLAMMAPPVVWHGTDLQLVSGQGEQTPAGLVIRQPGPQGLAVAQSAVRGVRATLYHRLSWQVEGLEPGRELRLIWATAADPQTTREKVLPPVGPEGGLLDLSAEAGWRDRIVAIGLVVSGPLPQPLIVRHLELRSVPPTNGELLRWMIADWTAFEDWSQRSINYTAGAPLDALFPPVVIVALWVGFSSALYALYVRFVPPRQRVRGFLPYTALFLLGWLALDLRWQWDLGQRLEQTTRSFAGEDETSRRLAALDGELYRFLLEVRRRLPEEPARIFIVSNDPTGFWAGRARYHLLPHNGYAGLSRIPQPGEARAGDYVLILSPLPDVGYDPGPRVLAGPNVRWPAEMLHVAASGALFRLRGD